MYYRDLRGSMAQFDPITSEQVVSVSNGTLTYTALSQRLAEYGLSIEKIVFDNNRPFSNAFYADFERALYCEIYLQMQNFEEGHRPLFRELERKCESGNERLAEQDWSSFYTIDVPLPMQAYDFQKRMPQIDPLQVFDVWMQIYKRLDYSNGVWLPETIAYVFFMLQRQKSLPHKIMGWYSSTGEWANFRKMPNLQSHGLPTPAMHCGLLTIPAGVRICCLEKCSRRTL